MSETSTTWKTPPATLLLEPNEVHLWSASLQSDVPSLEYYRALLSEDETRKAGKYYFEKDRNHYTIARGVLRSLLGHYLYTNARSLRFDYNEYGKPLLIPFNKEHNDETRTLHFNLSHSGEIALYAFSYRRHVGIDVELMRSNIEYDDLARISFSPNERTVLHTLEAGEKLQGFYNCWTRKEAFIKAIGKGLSHPLASFDVSLRPNETARLLANREPDGHSDWALLDLDVAHGYAGALAAEGFGWQPRFWQWNHQGRETTI